MTQGTRGAAWAETSVNPGLGWRRTSQPVDPTGRVRGRNRYGINGMGRRRLGENIPPNFLRREVLPDGGCAPTLGDLLLGKLLGVPPLGHVRTTFP